MHPPPPSTLYLLPSPCHNPKEREPQKFPKQFNSPRPPSLSLLFFLYHEPEILGSWAEGTDRITARVAFCRDYCIVMTHSHILLWLVGDILYSLHTCMWIEHIWKWLKDRSKQTEIMPCVLRSQDWGISWANNLRQASQKECTFSHMWVYSEYHNQKHVQKVWQRITDLNQRVWHKKRFAFGF